MAVTVINATVDDLPKIEQQYGEGLIIQDCDMNPYCIYRTESPVCTEY